MRGVEIFSKYCIKTKKFDSISGHFDFYSTWETAKTKGTASPVFFFVAH